MEVGPLSVGVSKHLRFEMALGLANSRTRKAAREALAGSIDGLGCSFVLSFIFVEYGESGRPFYFSCARAAGAPR